MTIELDENNYLTGNWDSSNNNEGWIEVDSIPSVDDLRAYQYINGEFVLDEDKLKILQEGLNADIKITELKQYLSDTDYVVIKIAEGAATREDYSDIITKRQEARTQINELEKLL